MLAGQRVLITGATRGVGRALAEACGARAAIVAVGHRSSSSALAESVASGIVGARTVELDAADAASTERAVEELLQDWGGVDVLVANAGVVRPSLLLSSSLADLELTVRTNLLGPLWAARAVLPAMLRQRGGTLLFIGSVAAAAPARGQAAYAATKGGLESLTRAIAVEYGRKGVRALCARLGPVDTDMLAPTLALAPDAGIEPSSAAEVAAQLAELLTDTSVDNGAVVPVSRGARPS